MLCQYKVLGSNYSRFHYVYRAHLVGYNLDVVVVDVVVVGICFVDWLLGANEMGVCRRENENYS